jgi:predicted Holliday junction resolvase-like endonuclease
LFDGTKQFPPKAEKKKLALAEELDGLNQEIKDRLDALKKLKISADKTSEEKALSTGLGKVMQNVLPHLKDFNSQVTMADCRFIAAQLDIIVFEGASNNHIKNITFMDAKTGKAPPQKNQKQIRDAVNDGKVRSELF